MGIEPRPKAEKFGARAADTGQQFRSPRNKVEKSGKQSSVDETEFRRRVNRSDSNDSNSNLAEAATSSFAVSRVGIACDLLIAVARTQLPSSVR
jgi:hypothetical protein